MRPWRPRKLHPVAPAVAVCARCDDMTVIPVSLSQVLATFSDVYSLRIIGRVDDYYIRIAHVRGEHVWRVHDHTDEFFRYLTAGSTSPCGMAAASGP
jgi:hypothetical protein